MFVVGAPRALAEVDDLAHVEVVFQRNDDDPVSATGAAVLGHPANAVAWLANTLAMLGGGLRAGQTVLSGSFTSAFDARPGDRFCADFASAGRICLDVA